MENDANQLLGRTPRISWHKNIRLMPWKVRGLDEAGNATQLEIASDQFWPDSMRTVLGNNGAAKLVVLCRNVQSATQHSERVSSSKNSSRMPQLPHDNFVNSEGCRNCLAFTSVDEGLCWAWACKPVS